MSTSYTTKVDLADIVSSGLVGKRRLSGVAEMVWHTHNVVSSKDEQSSEVTKFPESEPTSFMELVHSYWRKYCDQSTIHGVRYLYDPSVRYVERLIWSALVITCVVFTTMAYIGLSERYSSQRMETVVENSQYPIFHVPFPAVGVCVANRINWSKLEAAKKEFLPPNADKNMIDVFTNFVSRMDTMQFDNFATFKDMDDINLESLDFLHVSRLATFLALNCSDIFHNDSCIWRKEPLNCCEAFIQEKTERGMCLVFNSLISAASQRLAEMEKPFYPRHNSKAGQGTGLGFTIYLNDSFRRPNTTAKDSISVMIKKPDQWSNSAYTIIPNSESYIVVRPELTDTDENTRHLTPEQRNCLFTDEASNYRTIKNIRYRQANCINVCHEEHLIKYCNCTLSLFFQSDTNVRQCKPIDFRCLAKHHEIFSYDKRKEEDAYFSSTKPGMLCSCLGSCDSMNYYTSLTTLSIATTKLAKNRNISKFDLDVHYQTDSLVKYRAGLEFTSIDLIANFGGIFGLCLGASMMSAVELIYHLTVGFGLYLHDNNYYSVFKLQVKGVWARVVRYWKTKIAADHHNSSPNAIERHPHKKRNAW